MVKKKKPFERSSFETKPRVGTIPIPIPNIRYRGRIDAFDTARDLPTLVVSYLMLCYWCAVSVVLLSRTMFSLISWNFDLFVCVGDATIAYWTINFHSARQPCIWSSRSCDLPVNSMSSQYQYWWKTSVSYSVSYRFKNKGYRPILILSPFSRAGARCSKLPKTFWVRKAKSKTAIRLF